MPTLHGIARYTNGQWSEVGPADGILPGPVKSVSIDSEGALWVIYWDGSSVIWLTRKDGKFQAEQPGKEQLASKRLKAQLRLLEASVK
jgi:hypothetical protein